MKKLHRRNFLKTTATVGAGSFVLQPFAIGKPGLSANSKLNVAVIGASGAAGWAYAGCENENIVALADVNSDLFFELAEKFPFIQKAKTFTDFRVMLDKMGQQIDAVCVNTPDHTHFPATMEAMQRGKHVFTQKPLTHNVWQARTLIKAKEKYGVVTNMGNQGHTSNGIRQMREWYEAGVLGQVTEVHLGTQGPDWEGKYFELPNTVPLETKPVPSGLNWDLWQGPVPETAYNPIYQPRRWRGFYKYGAGQIGDWFSHIADAPVWILDLYEPATIECIERGPTPMDGMAPHHSIVRFDFPARGDKPPCSVYWYEHSIMAGSLPKTPEEWDLGAPPDRGAFWYGTQQNAYTDKRSSNPRLSTRHAMMDFNKGADIPQNYERVEGGPVEEWVRAIKGEGPEPGSNFDYAGRLTAVGQLGAIAQRFGGRIEWDAKAGRITNRPELNACIKEPVRPGWEYGEDL